MNILIDSNGCYQLLSRIIPWNYMQTILTIIACPIALFGFLKNKEWRH